VTQAIKTIKTYRLGGHTTKAQKLLAQHLHPPYDNPELLAEAIYLAILVDNFELALALAKRLAANRNDRHILEPASLLYLREVSSDDPVFHEWLEHFADRIPGWYQSHDSEPPHHNSETRSLRTEIPYTITRAEICCAEDSQFDITVQCSRCNHEHQRSLRRTFVVCIPSKCPSCFGHSVFGFDEVVDWLEQNHRSEYIDPDKVLSTPLSRLIYDFIQTDPDEESGSGVASLLPIETHFYLSQLVADYYFAHREFLK